IPLFEKNGFVKKLDFYVYEEVFKFLHHLKENSLPLVPVSINMSRKHNSPDRFIHDFMEIFHRYDISPSLVQVELLEHSVMEKTDLLETTELLHKEGFTVAIDDFGTGESSLTMLSKIPVDVLKFDKSFLQESMSGPIDIKTQKFIRALIEISKELDKLTVFEGVETEEQKNFLKENNCDLVQGYYYSKPLTQKDFEDFLVTHI
ncbi:MAG: EAL domain-containing protein, partial [Treponema sp.]|nr:EAL domain-containing protein [Treponema sp.]